MHIFLYPTDVAKMICSACCKQTRKHVPGVPKLQLPLAWVSQMLYLTFEAIQFTMLNRQIGSLTRPSRV
jgi:hypothetical protein